MKHSIAIVVIAYNRDKSLARLLNSVGNAYIDKGTTLIVSIDKSNNSSVEACARHFDWPYGEKRIIAHPKNLGLKQHILSCGNYLDEYDALVVLEDDLIVSDNFYMYAVQAVEKYFDNKEIAGISLYSFGVNYQTFYPFKPQPSQYDTYFMKCAQSWGQVWMKDQWKAFENWYAIHRDDEFDRTLLPEAICSWSAKSWLKYHTRYCIEMNKYFIYPYQSLTSNCGETGTHLKFSSPVFQRPVAKLERSYQYKFPNLSEDSVKYDGFFESEQVLRALGMNKVDLCMDLTKAKTNFGNKRYVLTTKRLGYRVVKSYGLSYAPIEMNVIHSCPGELLFLYDTTERCKEPRFKSPVDKRVLFAYENDVDIFAVIRRLRQYGIVNILKTLIKAL